MYLIHNLYQLVVVHSAIVDNYILKIQMDAITPKYSKERYNTIVEHVRSFLQKIGFDPAFVTISGLDGDIDHEVRQHGLV